MHVFTAICKRFIDYKVTNGATMTYNDIYRMRLIDWDSVFKIAFELLTVDIERKIEKTIKKVGELSYVRYYDLLHSAKLDQN